LASSSNTSIGLRQAKNVPLTHLAAGKALVLDNAPLLVLLAILLAHRSA
jgi:hypothetical protein